MLKFQQILGYFIVGLLAFTAALKFVAAFQTEAILLERDPILLIPNGALLIVASVVEVAVALSIIVGKDIAAKQGSILWLAACFAAYRIAHWIGDYSEPCACLGTGFSWWPWLSAHRAGVSLAAFWLFVSCALLYKYSSAVGKFAVFARREVLTQ